MIAKEREKVHKKIWNSHGSPFTLNIKGKERKTPADVSSNMIFTDWQSKKYCLASNLRFSAISDDLNLGRRKGEEIEIDEGPLSRESGSYKDPGFAIKSTKYSLTRNKCFQQ